MQIKSLNEIKIATLVACFNEAFADYFVKMPTTIDFWDQRWKAARVDYSLSYGMFDKNKIVGFIINGIDLKENKLTAFNTGTGVIPKYRGKRIVKQLYDFAIPELVKNGVEACALEVITNNEKAIKAYQSVGFEITKTLKCYSGKLKVASDNHLTLRELAFEKIDWNQLPDQKYFSWDNHKNAIGILKKNYKCFEVFEQTERISYFIVNPHSGNLAQFDLLNDGNESDWQKLFAGIKNIVSTLKINNIDVNQTDKINAIQKTGLSLVIDQYEMEYFF